MMPAPPKGIQDFSTNMMCVLIKTHHVSAKILYSFGGISNLQLAEILF